MLSLQQIRHVMDCTQDELAALVKVTPQTIRNLESGRSHAKSTTRRKFENRFGRIDWQATFEQGKLNLETQNN